MRQEVPETKRRRFLGGRRRIGAFLVALACGGLGMLAAGAREAPSEGITSLAWLAGHWRSESDGSIVEELWLPPRGGILLGLNRTVAGDGRRTGFEYLRIQRNGEDLEYVASPGGRSPTSFRLVEQTSDRVLFTNPEHDFPKRIEYRLEGEYTLLVRATDDEGRGPSWTWRRIARLD